MANTAFRGELYFTAPELESFRKRLHQLWSPGSAEDAVVNVPWQLAPLDGSASRALHLHNLDSLDMDLNLPPRRERSNSRTLRMSNSAQSFTKEVPGHSTIDDDDDDIDSLFKEIMDEEDDEDFEANFTEPEVQMETNEKAFPQLNETVEYEKDTVIYALLHPEKGTFSNMPSWVEKIHGIIVQLCQYKTGQLFINSPEPATEKKEENMETEAQPQLFETMSLSIILENLLKNKYTSTTEVFADVYMTLVTAFEREPAGNEKWMSAQDACARLEGLRRDSGLVDSETAHVAGFGGKHPPAAHPRLLVKPLPANLDFVAEIQPITKQEKMQFHEILQFLPPERHLELYIAFEYTAIWRNLGTGELELDDEATNPSVFREMMKWSKERCAQMDEEQQIC